MLAALLSAHAVPGAASLTSIPRGSGTKVAAVICRGWRRAHWHALISERTAQPCAAAHLPGARRPRSAGGQPPWGRTANPQLAVCGGQALFGIRMSPPFPDTNPYRHWHECKMQESSRNECWGPAPLRPRCAEGLSPGSAWGLTYLCLWVTLRSDGWAALLASTTLGTTLQYMARHTKAHLPCAGASAHRARHGQECCRPRLTWNLQLCFCLSSGPHSGVGMCFLFYTTNPCFTEHLHREPVSTAPYQHADFWHVQAEVLEKASFFRMAVNVQVNSNITWVVTAVGGARAQTTQARVPLQQCGVSELSARRAQTLTAGKCAAPGHCGRALGSPVLSLHLERGRLWQTKDRSLCLEPSKWLTIKTLPRCPFSDLDSKNWGLQGKSMFLQFVILLSFSGANFKTRLWPLERRETAFQHDNAEKNKKRKLVIFLSLKH